MYNLHATKLNSIFANRPSARTLSPYARSASPTYFTDKPQSQPGQNSAKIHPEKD